MGMMTTLPTAAQFEFRFDDRLIRGLTIDGQPWFVAADVAAALRYRDADKLKRLLREHEKGTHSVGTLGGTQRMSTITEPGLYRAIMARKVSDEKDVVLRRTVDRFQDWVVFEVLPSIRTTGSYAPVAAPATAIDVRDPSQLAAISLQLVQLTQELQEKLALEQAAGQAKAVALADAHHTLDTQRPIVLAHERIAASEGSMTLSEAAVSLKVDRGAVIEHLLQLGMLIRAGAGGRLRCSRSGLRSGLVEQHGAPVGLPDGRQVMGTNPRLTASGYAYLAKHFCRGVAATRQPVIPGM